MCQSLDQKVHNLKKKLKEKDTEVKRLQAELTLMKTQQDTLIKGLKYVIIILCNLYCVDDICDVLFKCF